MEARKLSQQLWASRCLSPNSKACEPTSAPRSGTPPSLRLPALCGGLLYGFYPGVTCILGKLALPEGLTSSPCPPLSGEDPGAWSLVCSEPFFCPSLVPHCSQGRSLALGHSNPLRCEARRPVRCGGVTFSHSRPCTPSAGGGCGKEKVWILPRGPTTPREDLPVLHSSDRFPSQRNPF